MLVRRRLASVLLLVLLALGAPAAASREDEHADDGMRPSVARLAWLEGNVSVARGEAPDEWQPGAVNEPLTTGDRLRVGSDGRAELQLRGAVLFLAPGTEIALSNLARDARSLALSSGTATVRVFDSRGAREVEIAAPNVSVALELPGAYRIDVGASGDSSIRVARGRARAATAEGEVRIGWGERMRVFGLARPSYDVVDFGLGDAWDRWVERRSRRLRDVRSAARVHADVLGIDDLDEWGDWESTSEWGWVWFPRVSRADWTPYRFGSWTWRAPWGWAWLSAEPWGWAPYHHGRWGLVRNRWAWVPVGPREPRPAWSPATVAFVESEPGQDAPLGGDGFVGWFPLGPREPLHPWWTRSTEPASDPSYRHLHRDRALYLPRAVFARGRFDERDLVHDVALLRDLRNSPPRRGPLPALPEADGNQAPGASADAPGAPAPRASALRPPLPVRRPTPPPRAGGAAPTPAPTPALPPKPPSARRPGPLPRPPDAPTTAAPPWEAAPKPPQPGPLGNGGRSLQPVTSPRSDSGSPGPR